MHPIRNTAWALAALASAGAAIGAPALAATPDKFTSQGMAISYAGGKATRVPNTLYYNQGKIRLEMAQPVSADATTAFSVVLAHEGGKTITLLNTQQRQAMKLDASSLQSVTDNPSLQKISNFRLGEFGRTFRSKARSLGHATVAGERCTILDQTGRDGHFRLWLSDRYDVPMRFTYFEGAKPAFSYEVSRFSTGVKLPAASFNVPSGYQTTDLSEAIRSGGVSLER